MWAVEGAEKQQGMGTMVGDDILVGDISNLSDLTHSGYLRYLYHQGNEQTTGGTMEAAAKPWLIPAGKYFAAHRPQGQHPP